jgi:hypothetical protein
MALTRSALEGHEETLIWADFQGKAPSSAGGEAAYASARFDLNFDYEWDDSHGSAHGYRINHVQVQVEIERSVMWSVKSDRTAELLQHEQGHYDIVALLGRDLYNELTGWNWAKGPKRFRRETDLKDEANRRLRGFKRLAAHIAGSSQSEGVYDVKTNHGTTARVQAQWTAAFAAARKDGTPLMKALSGLGVGPGP